MACFSVLSPWLVGFGNEDPKWTFAIYVLPFLNLYVMQNISKAPFDRTIMPHKYVGQHVSYLLALCQMNCIIAIWCHMCMEAHSTCNRCCWNALDSDIESQLWKRIPKISVEGYFSLTRVLQHQKGAMFVLLWGVFLGFGFFFFLVFYLLG